MTDATTPTVVEMTARIGAAPRPRGRTLVIGARVALTMILVAGAAILALGLATLVLVDPSEWDGWLRSAFGAAFGYIALGMAAFLGLPSAIGVWALAGATAEDTVPALSLVARRVVVGVAIIVVIVVAAMILVGGRGATLLDLGVIGLVALLTLGLAGAAACSPHRARAIMSGAASVVVWVSITWFVATVAIAA
jgi:hypothetical protein